ncbi:MAG: hypothetical protein M1570_02020 [Chloroflexi bacterium]|nr:hypothetical protein [Chloroflexota bacterium]
MTERLAGMFAVRDRSNWPFYVAVAAIVLIALFVRGIYAAGNPTLDDAFITFRYVRNLARGIGFVYNPGERVLGTTTPLFTLLLTPFAIAGADIVSTSKIITVLASTANVLLVAIIARRLAGPWAALFAAMLLAISTNSVWAASTGLETELNVLVLLALFLAYLAAQYNLSAAIAAIAVITRPDDLILVAVLVAWHLAKLARGRRKIGLVPLGTFAAVLAPWVIFATLYFGSPIPSSIVGKAASYRVPLADNLAMYAVQYGFAMNTPRAIASTVLFVIGLVYLLARKDDSIVLPAYFAVYSAAFVIAGARLGSGWYWQPLWPVHSVLVACGIVAAGVWLKRFAAGKSVERLVPVAAAAFLVLFILACAGSAKSRFFDPRPADDLEWAELADAGRWLAQNTPPAATVGAETFGAVGWYSDRYIVDEGGLISPQVAQINDKLGRPDFFNIIRTFQPDYYLAWIHGELDVVNSVPEQKAWLAEHYRTVGSFDVGIGRAPYFELFKRLTD